jgi:hypothetical protein
LSVDGVYLYRSEIRRTNLSQEQGRDDPQHAAMNGGYKAWEKVRIFCPDKIREEAWPAICRP